MLYFAEGAADKFISTNNSALYIDQLIGALSQKKQLKRVLIIPPDFTRFHSGAGPLTVTLYKKLAALNCEVVILPALGTHFPMDSVERHEMFPGIPDSAFRNHHFRNEVKTLGQIEPEFLAGLSEGQLKMPVEVQLNKLLTDQPWDAIISVGQLVPHEVIGIANHIKNILVGVGGFDLINKSHWLGAVYGMERIMGRAESPVRTLLNEAAKRFLSLLPIVYLLTVRQRLADGQIGTRGLYAGNDQECFLRGADLCKQVNLDIVPRGPKKCVVYLDPHEFKSTWLGNKAIYRTRMMMADRGELIILAPGVKQFGEDQKIDELIRQFGYFGTPKTLQAVQNHSELSGNLSAAAHLIHGSSEGRFQITYCPALSRKEIENVGFGYRDLNNALNEFDISKLKDGWNIQPNGEEIFYVSNPALGLWGTKERFGN